MDRRSQIIIAVALILLGSLKVYNTQVNRKNRQKQIQMMEDLSSQQLQDQIERDKEIVNSLPELTVDLDSARQAIEEIGKGLEEIGKDLEKLND